MQELLKREIERDAWMAEMSTRSLLRHYPAPVGQRFAAYAIDGQSQYLCLGLNVEGEVFGEAFGNDQDTLEREYGPYEPHSTFLLVVDAVEQKPAGVLRIIRWSSDAGLKTIKDLASQFLIGPDEVVQSHGIGSWSHVWDVGTLACRRGYRGGNVSGYLYGLLHQQCVANGAEHVVTVLEAAVLELLQNLGVPFQPICGSAPFPYMGSAKSIACHMRVADAGPNVITKLGADNWLGRQLAYGEGLPLLQVVR